MDNSINTPKAKAETTEIPPIMQEIVDRIAGDTNMSAAEVLETIGTGCDILPNILEEFGQIQNVDAVNEEIFEQGIQPTREAIGNISGTDFLQIPKEAIAQIKQRISLLPEQLRKVVEKAINIKTGCITLSVMTLAGCGNEKESGLRFTQESMRDNGAKETTSTHNVHDVISNGLAVKEGHFGWGEVALLATLWVVAGVINRKKGEAESMFGKFFNSTRLDEVALVGVPIYVGTLVLYMLYPDKMDILGMDPRTSSVIAGILAGAGAAFLSKNKK